MLTFPWPNLSADSSASTTRARSAGSLMRSWMTSSRPFDRIHLGLVHAVEKLPRVGAERLDVTPLAFGVEGVEDERRLAGARHARDHHQFPGGNRERQILEVVLARATDDDGVAGRELYLHLGGVWRLVRQKPPILTASARPNPKRRYSGSARRRRRSARCPRRRA